MHQPNWILKKYCSIKKLKLHLAETEDFSTEVLKILDDQFKLSTGSVNNDQLKILLQKVDIFWFRLGYKLNAEVIDNQSQCRFLVTPVTGIDHIDETLCKQLGIKIICLRGEFDFLKEVRATAEHTILLTMMLMRNAVPSVSDVCLGNWRRDLFRGHELYHKKVGIIGYGRLGRIVADYFHALGCKVGFYDTEDKEHPDHIHQFSNPIECIISSDIISVHIPYNKQNHHFLNEHLMSFFDASKWFINTSRGGIVEEEALLQLLHKNEIAGAAVDVIYGEPEVANNPLIDYAKSNKNLIITPHIGGCTYESFEKTEKFILNKLLTKLNHKIEA